MVAQAPVMVDWAVVGKVVAEEVVMDSVDLADPVAVVSHRKC